MGVMLLADLRLDMTYPSAFNHIAVNPLSLIVFISALGGLWTFIVRFVQAEAIYRRWILQTRCLNPA